MKSAHLLYGTDGLTVNVPDSAAVLTGQSLPALPDAAGAVKAALAQPIGTPSLAQLVRLRNPRTVAITISDITRPVPNRAFLPPILDLLSSCGIRNEDIIIIVGTGMHRPSTGCELRTLVGEDVLGRVEVIDHRAGDPATLVRVCDTPPVSICRRFAEADFRIVTGYIEPHFMAGFSGGRKGVCPALVDLETIQRFHGFDTLCDPRADNGVLDGNPCHDISLRVAKTVGVDFLFNVAIAKDRRMAGIYCGDLEQAHAIGCRQVAEWTTADIAHPFDLLITNGGGHPLDQTFYQTVKGMCTALPGLHRGSTLLQVSHCGEGVGSAAYTELMLHYGNDWHRFLRDIEENRHETKLDQWEYQMQCRVLGRIGIENLRLVTDGIPHHLQSKLSVAPVLGVGDARTRLQRAIDCYLSANPAARVAIVPEGPYTMLRPTR